MHSRIESTPLAPNPVVVDGALKRLPGDVAVPPRFVRLSVPNTARKTVREVRIPFGKAEWTDTPKAHITNDGTVRVDAEKKPKWVAMNVHTPPVFELPSRVLGKTHIPEVPIERWEEQKRSKRLARKAETLESLRAYKEKRTELQRRFAETEEKRKLIANADSQPHIRHAREIGSSTLKLLRDKSHYVKTSELLSIGAVSATFLALLSPHILTIGTVNAITGAYYLAAAGSVYAVAVGAFAKLRASIISKDLRARKNSFRD